MSRTTKIVISIILFGILVLVVIPPHIFSTLFGAKPADIGEVQSIEIQLWDPLDGKSKMLYEGAITDTEKINVSKQLFMEESLPNSDHKCPSLGVFKFQTTEGERTIEILPGHNDDFYEFRYNGNAFKVDREKYITMLRSITIPDKAIVLDGHPAIE